MQHQCILALNYFTDNWQNFLVVKDCKLHCHLKPKILVEINSFNDQAFLKIHNKIAPWKATNSKLPLDLKIIIVIFFQMWFTIEQGTVEMRIMTCFLWCEISETVWAFYFHYALVHIHCQ